MRTAFCALLGIIGLGLIKGQDILPYKPLDLSYRYQPPDLDPNDPRAKFLRPANVVIRFSRGPVSGVVDNGSVKETKEKIQEEKQFIFVQQPNTDVNGSPTQSPEPFHQPDSELTFQPPKQLQIPFTAKQSTTPQVQISHIPLFVESVGGPNQETPPVQTVEDDSLRQNSTQQKRPLRFFEQYSLTNEDDKENNEEETSSLQPIPQVKSVENDRFSRKPISQLGRPIHVFAQHSLNDEKRINADIPTRQITLLQPTRESYFKRNQQSYFSTQHSIKSNKLLIPIAKGSHQQHGVILNSPESVLKKTTPQLKKANPQSTPKFQQVTPQRPSVQKYKDESQESFVQHTSLQNTFYRKNPKEQKPVSIPTVRYKVSELPRSYGQQQRQIQETKSNRDKDFDDQLIIDIEGDLSAIPGKAGSDYPTISNIPRTSFTCEDKLPGFYASVEHRCQLYHHCSPQGRMQSFLCPNGTVYNQLSFVCEWWYNVNCGNSENYFKRNNDLYTFPDPRDEKKLKVEPNPARFKPSSTTSKHRSLSVAAPPPVTSQYRSPSEAAPPPATSQYRSPSEAATPQATSQYRLPSVAAPPPVTSQYRSPSVAAPPPATSQYRSPSVAAPPPATKQYRSPSAAAPPLATNQYRSPSAAAPPLATNQYRSPSEAAPPPATSEYRSPSVAAPPPATNQYRSPSEAAPPPATSEYRSPSVAAPPPATNQYRSPSEAAPPPATSEYRSPSVAAQPPATNQYRSPSIAVPPLATSQYRSPSVAVSPVRNLDQFSQHATQDNGALSARPHKAYIFGRRLNVQNEK
ncbi:uncharacterized protein LOC143239437 [Tachypleus tridentatus]|uniref:uncharacterized protein LOC143239437 n=1 Tax=Tachypleus tridentatus TaxID=6853 RepID=UPI003FD50F6C